MIQLDLVSFEMAIIKERFASGVSADMKELRGGSLEFHERSNSLVLFGGSIRSDVFWFRVESSTWEMMNTKSSQLTPRCEHASCVVVDNMYIYGGKFGYAPAQYLNDLVVLTLWPVATWSVLVEHHGMSRRGASMSSICGQFVGVWREGPCEYFGRTCDSVDV